MALLDQARATTRAAVLTLPTGDAGLYQVVASRALAAAHITRASADPPGGRINRDAAGEPNGLLEDSAHAVFSTLIPPLTPQKYEAAARAGHDGVGHLLLFRRELGEIERRETRHGTFPRCVL